MMGIESSDGCCRRRGGGSVQRGRILSRGQEGGVERRRGGRFRTFEPVKEVLAGTEFEDEEEPFGRLESLVKGDDVRVVREGLVNRGLGRRTAWARKEHVGSVWSQ